MKLNELHELINTLLASNGDKDPVFIQYMPGKSVSLNKKELTEENRNKFIEAMKKIPNIYKGISHLTMTGIEDFELNVQEAIICCAIGKAFKLWNLFPMDWEDPMRSNAINNDRGKMLPMISEMNRHGV